MGKKEGRKEKNTLNEKASIQRKERRIPQTCSLGRQGDQTRRPLALFALCLFGTPSSHLCACTLLSCALTLYVYQHCTFACLLSLSALSPSLWHFGTLLRDRCEEEEKEKEKEGLSVDIEK